MPGLYAKPGKKRVLYYTLYPDYIALGHDLATARRRLLELQNGKYVVGTLGDLLDEFMTYRVDLSERTGKPSRATIEGNKREVVFLKDAFGRMSIHELQPRHVWEYLKVFRGRHAAVRANREISLLGACYRYARNRGLVKSNPVQGAEKNVEKPRERLVLLEELESFCQFLRNRKEGQTSGNTIAAAFMLGFLTGKAVSQILSIKRGDILEAGIAFGARKGGHATLVEWTPKLRSVVEPLLSANTESEYLVCSRAGSKYTLHGFSAVWRRAMVKWLAERQKTVPTAEKFHFHDLRAAAISVMKEQNRDPKELTGHTSNAMPDRVYDRRRHRKAPAVM